jgi:DNA-binding IclR family transcriptional regulator
VRKTRFATTSATQLDAELAKVRSHGFAFDREESFNGFGCIAAPIGAPGQAVAAVSVCGPMSAMKFDPRLAAPVRMIATGIWRGLRGAAHRTAPTPREPRPLSPLAPNSPRTHLRAG